MVAGTAAPALFRPWARCALLLSFALPEAQDPYAWHPPGPLVDGHVPLHFSVPADGTVSTAETGSRR